jgi:hypothetical protein
VVAARLGGSARAAALSLVALAGALAACIASSGPDPSACGAPTFSAEVRLTERGLEPSGISVCRGQRVVISIEAAIDGVLHVQGYDEEIPLLELQAGDRDRIAFEAVRSGQFPIELHSNAAPAGESVGILTVHER